jgi:hypothetical protein
VDTRGTVTGASGTNTLTGTNTHFTVEVGPGEDIKVGADLTTVQTVTSDTVLKIQDLWSVTHTAQQLKLVYPDPDVDVFRVQIAKGPHVDTSQTPDEWDRVYDHHRQRGTHHAFKIPQADEDEPYMARVQAIDAALNKSAWVAATRAGNSDPNVDGQRVRLLRDRTVKTFTIDKGVIDANGVGYYQPAWKADRDYRVKVVHATAGLHDAGTHPADGCPDGGPLEMNVRIFVSDQSSDVAMLASDAKISITNHTHQDTAGGDDSDFATRNVDQGQHLAIKVTAVPTTVGSVQVSVVLIPRDTTT